MKVKPQAAPQAGRTFARMKYEAKCQVPGTCLVCTIGPMGYYFTGLASSLIKDDTKAAIGGTLLEQLSGTAARPTIEAQRSFELTETAHYSEIARISCYISILAITIVLSIASD